MNAHAVPPCFLLEASTLSTAFGLYPFPITWDSRLTYLPKGFRFAAPEGFSTRLTGPVFTIRGLADSSGRYTRFHQSFY
jgi:hypothetical protein